MQVFAMTTFEMKAQGSTYPTTTPAISSSASANGTAAGTASSSTSTPSAKSAASALAINLQGLFGAVVGAGAFVVGFF